MTVTPPTARVDRTLLAGVFGARSLVTVADGALAPVRHARSREVLRSTGLPRCRTGWFQPVLDLPAEIADKGWPNGAARYPELADQGYAFAEWIAVGGTPYDTVILDAASGRLYVLPDGGSAPYPLATGLDTLLWLLCRVRTARDHGGDRPTAAALTAELCAIDPVSCERRSAVRHFVEEAVAG